MKPLQEPQTTYSTELLKSPRLILIGVVGVMLASLGVPVPLLSCLLLIGGGADRDLARRAIAITEQPDATVWSSAATSLLRLLHAILYATLFALAWGAMLDLCQTSIDRFLLVADLLLSLSVLAFYATRTNDQPAID